MKLLLYCTKAKPYIKKFIDGKYKELASFYNLQDLKDYVLFNGKIVAECDFEVEEIELVKSMPITPISDAYVYVTKTITNNTLVDKACLTYPEMEKYLGKLNYGGKNGYAIHIKNLHIFDEPRELRFYYQKYKGDRHLYNIEKAPQNMMRAIGKQGDVYTLISIRPEWLCKILNGEKKIEVRRKVLKEMLK